MENLLDKPSGLHLADDPDDIVAMHTHLEKTKAKAKADLTQATGDLETEKSTMSSIVEAKRVIEQDKGCVMGAGNIHSKFPVHVQMRSLHGKTWLRS